MKSDLDSYMQEAGIDALMVTGPAQHNPAMFYLTGGAMLTQADLIKPAAQEPILFYNPMERDGALSTGLQTKNLVDYGLRELLKECNGQLAQAYARRYQMMLTDAGVTSGRVSVYGKTEIGELYGRIKAMEQLMPEIEFVGEQGNSVLRQAMATKDEVEVERIRRVGQITVEVVDKVREYLSSHLVRDSMLVKADGQPLRIGDVKNKINLWLGERGLENPHGTIFAIGRDAGVPHNEGNPQDVLDLGKTIVFDIFPQEAGGGYHYDFTRTWSLGFAGQEIESIYDDVRAAYDSVMNSLQMGSPGADYQEMVSDLFEARGHRTTRQDPAVQSGYVHGLGHGVGLHIHESPSFRNREYATPFDRLHPGAVMTVEPGLYYPDREIGCRLEDTIWVRPDGAVEVLVDYPLDLVIPVRTEQAA